MRLLEVRQSRHVNDVHLFQVGIVLRLAAVILLPHLGVHGVGLDRIEQAQIVIALVEVGLQLDDLLERIDRLVVVLQFVEDTAAAEPEIDVVGIAFERLVDHAHQVGGITHALLRGIELHQAVENLLVLRELLDTCQQCVLRLDEEGRILVFLAVIAVEQIVVDIARLVGITGGQRVVERLCTARERFGMVRSVDGQQIAGIVEERRIGLAESGALLRLVGGQIGLGARKVFARFDRDIAQNRGVIGDLLQTVLDLRRLLGIQLVGLVIGFDRRIEGAFLDLLQLLPCHDLPVALVGDEIGIVPCNGFRTVERHLLGARGIAHRKFQQRRLHRSEQVGRRFRCGVVIDSAAIDPRGGLGVLLGIRDVGIALLEFGQRRLLIHFLRFGSRNGQQRSGCGHQNESFHTRFN